VLWIVDELPFAARSAETAAHAHIDMAGGHMMDRKVCVITGSSSGIGAACAELFAQRGWDVCVNYSRTAAICQGHGADVLLERADVADDAQCLHLAARVKERFGRCDALVNNAGTTKFVGMRDLQGLDAGDFQNIYAVNVIGVFQMTRALVPLMQQAAGAAVVNISSISSINGIGSSIAYIASKGALNSLTIALARALGPGIRVNAVAPGMVDSRWLRDGLGEERFAAAQAAYESSSSLASLVTPKEVAESVYWFAAGAAKTTGEFQLVDGGRFIGRL
jgi:NAD(P)-dependent dehydrogenase (short-subunit alcohol dehydrogenase family)